MTFPVDEIKNKFLGNATISAAIPPEQFFASRREVGFDGDSGAPDQPQLPYATYSITGLKKDMTFVAGYTQPVNVRFTVYASDPDQIQALHQAVQDTFERAIGTKVIAYQPIWERIYESRKPFGTGEVLYVSVNAYRAIAQG